MFRSLASSINLWIDCYEFPHVVCGTAHVSKGYWMLLLVSPKRYDICCEVPQKCPLLHFQNDSFLLLVVFLRRVIGCFLSFKNQEHTSWLGSPICRSFLYGDVVHQVLRLAGQGISVWDYFGCTWQWFQRSTEGSGMITHLYIHCAYRRYIRLFLYLILKNI